MKKPDPRFYRIAAERLGVQKHEVLFLDHASACVEGARDVGMRAVRYLNNDQAVTQAARSREAPPPSKDHQLPGAPRFLF